MASPLARPALRVAGLLGVGVLCLGVPATRAAPAPEAVEEAPAPTLDMQDLESKVRVSWRPTAEKAHAALDKNPADAVAWAHLSRAVEHGGKPYTALMAFAEGYRHSPQTMAPLLPRALDLAMTLNEEAWFGGLLADGFSLPMDADTRARLALVVARHHFAEGAWGAALGLLPLVPDDGALGLEAAVLKGTVLAMQKRYTEALPLQLTAYERARQQGRDERYVSTLALNAARTLFAAKSWEQAYVYYDRVPRSDPAWSRAQLEKAWAAFRAQDMEAVLGILQTHETPFFDGFYQPEAAMLRAQALYLLCKFPSTTTAIDDFQAHYQPILDALDARLDAMSPGDALADARAELEGGTPTLPRMVLREVVWDGRLAAQLGQVRDGRHELKSLSWIPRAEALVSARVDAVSEEADARLLAELQDKQVELQDLLSNIELTRVDLLSLQADMYQRASATGESPQAVEARVSARKALRRKGKRVWPYQGESWIDELGAYQVRTPSECPEGLSRGE